jgi:hypothetical protein
MANSISNLPNTFPRGTSHSKNDFLPLPFLLSSAGRRAVLVLVRAPFVPVSRYLSKFPPSGGEWSKKNVALN